MSKNFILLHTRHTPMSFLLPQIQQEVLVMWGRNDEILEPSYAERFQATLPRSSLVWAERCGHCAHLEQPAFAAEQILGFAHKLTAPVKEAVTVASG